MAAPAFQLHAGALVAGKYRVGEALGAGGMSAVYSAVHVGLDQRIALKVLHPQHAADVKLVQRFMREAKASARISGEHVGRVLDVGATDEGSPFIALELLTGEDLGDYIDRSGPLPIGEAVDLVLQACDGIARAHSVGIIHRDIKPSNLFLTQRDGRPCLKVIDFGISKVISDDGHAFTQTTEIFGSPQYMSPEQVRASRDVDVRTDVWALGCVLYELLTAEVPFEAASVMMLGAVILNEKHRKVRELRPEIPAGLDQIVDRCLAKEPSGRPSTVVELATLLEPWAQHDGALIETMRRLGLQAPPPSSLSPSAVESEPRGEYAATVHTGADLGFVARNSKRLVVVSAGLLTGGLIAGGLAMRSSHPVVPRLESPVMVASAPLAVVEPAPVPAPTSSPVLTPSAAPVEPHAVAAASVAKPTRGPKRTPTPRPSAATTPAPTQTAEPANPSTVRDRFGGD